MKHAGSLTSGPSTDGGVDDVEEEEEGAARRRRGHRGGGRRDRERERGGWGFGIWKSFFFLRYLEFGVEAKG